MDWSKPPKRSASDATVTAREEGPRRFMEERWETRAWWPTYLRGGWVGVRGV
jgi:hypothetical protein